MAEMPTGAVTFLFTDIEGSTRLVKQLRDRYGEVLADHQRLLRAAFASHEGHEVDTQGDSFFVAFANAREGVLAAVDAQRALLSHPWPEGVELKVRMGLHTGRAVATGGRYTGLAVHRAARIGAAAHGGQILVSQATQTLLEDEEEELHVSLQDLGEQRLKDLDRPVRLYQVAAEGLPSSFPPVRGEAALAQAAEAALAPPAWRRPLVLAAAAAVLALAVVLAVVLLTRPGSGGGLEGVMTNDVGLIAPNSVAVVDPATNRVATAIAVGAQASPRAGEGGGSATVAEGDVWVVNRKAATVSRIDAATRSVSTIGGFESEPVGLAVVGGTAWATERLAGLSRVVPGGTSVAETIALTGPGGAIHSAEAITSDERWLWVQSATLGELRLLRVDPRSGDVEREIALGSPSVHSIAFGEEAVWMTNLRANTLTRVDPRAGTVEATIDVTSPTAVAVGAGAVWVVSEALHTLYRVNPGTNLIEAAIRVGRAPVDVAVGEGAVWVANSGEGTVSRIDPETNAVSDMIAVTREEVIAVAAGRGGVWAVTGPAG